MNPAVQCGPRGAPAGGPEPDHCGVHGRAAQRHELFLDVPVVDGLSRLGDRCEIDPVLGSAEGELEHAEVLGRKERELAVTAAEGVADDPPFCLAVPLVE